MKNNFAKNTSSTDNSKLLNLKDNSRKNVNIFKCYLNRNFIIIASILISIFFIQKEISFLKNDIDTGDENLNMLVVKNIAATGLPVYGTYVDNITSPLYNKDALTIYYWEYAAELYLRTPFYLISEIIDFKWEYYSSLFYLYLVFLAIIIYSLKNKKSYGDLKLPLLSVAFFILIFSVSKLSISQFHYVRYYPFTLIIISLIHYFTNYVSVYSSDNSFKKYLIIIGISFIPGLFHMANLSYMFFWVTWLLISYLLINFKKINFPFKNNSILNIRNIFIGFLLFIILLALILFLLHFLNDRLYISYKNLGFIPGFLKYFFDLKYLLYDFIFIILLIFTFINIKKFNKIELNLFYTSIGFIVFCMIGFSIIGGKEIIHGARSYLLFLFPVIITIYSLMLSLLFRVINNFIPDFYFKEFIVFCTIAFLFITCNYDKFNDNERRAGSGIKKYERLKRTTNKFRNCVFVTSRNVHYFYNYFPHNKAYLYRGYNQIQETNIIKGELYKSLSGYIKNYGGEIYIGTKESLCRMLHENTNNVIFFDYVLPGLMDTISKINPGNPMSAKYLTAMLCGRNDSERTQNCIWAIKEKGLLEEEYASLGAYLFNHNLFNESIYSCQNVLTINPKNTRALVFIGLSYYQSGKIEEAYKTLLKALRIDPKSELAKHYLNLILDRNSYLLNKKGVQ